MSNCRQVGRVLSWSLVGLLGCLVLALALSGADWPVYKLSRVTEVTGIAFPKDARLVRAHYQNCISQILDAEIVLPRRELPAFLSQKLIRLDSAPYGDEAARRAGHRATYFFIENGMPTTLAVETEGGRSVILRIHLDEP